MPRTYIRKSVKQDEDLLKFAVKEVQSGKPLATIARTYDIPHGVLRSRVQKLIKKDSELVNRKQVFLNFIK